MTRSEWIRRLVLNGICDDYEDIEQITKYVHDVGPRCAITISHDEIIQTLRELIELGYAKAWDLSRWPDPATTDCQGMPPSEDITPMDPRFFRTEEGLAFQKARSTGGPFDEDHNLREGWLAPEASLRQEELVRLFILDSFRNFTHLRLGHVEMRWDSLAERPGISISRAEIIQALGELIGLGYLKASYKGREFWQYDGMPPLEDIKPFGAYFWVTGAGWDFLGPNDSWWPFDDDDNLRKDWVPPEI